MSSSKKKSLSNQIPKPMSIKKEKTEEDRTLHPISHYIDDRLELVKQIFGTLKPKTIVNLAPEFLKKTSLDEIEELCLNELICISTKRLKSIISDTPCPSDTDSSEDSDVERKEEHISLEEISSDSDIGGNDQRRAKKLRKSNAKRADKTSENKEPDGQISVLELLELQARARAIRSQLAMEPITKIEVKSDDDGSSDERQTVKHKTRDRHRSHRRSKRKSSELPTSTTVRNSESRRETHDSYSKESSFSQKRIKLKRNYRHSTKSPERVVERERPKQEISRETLKSRSASPDVITIPTEPETLLISDSTDDEGPKQTAAAEAVQSTVTPTPAAVPAEESEPEEGEVRDDIETETQSETSVKPTENETDTQITEVTPEVDTSAETTASTEEVSVESVENVEPVVPVEPVEAVESIQPVAELDHSLSTAIVDDDDIISIGGDLELIDELASVEDEPAVRVKSEEPEKLVEPEEEDNDVISLNTSEDDTEKLDEVSSESWRSRYLRSSKVSQVLAASRLGKRVRDKIKKSKRAQKHGEGREAGDAKSSSQQQQQFTSRHEDGSMEQYQELLQHRKRKSSNGSKSDK